ncbi:MAG: hypothetical protein BME93_04185 [Methanosarcinales archaeon Met12]|nr:MAG: hypothetical protein BME93_04185 [Methanosarcinales archaeon Met12]
MKIKNEQLLLFAIICAAIWYRLPILEGHIIPMFGNTMYHVGIIRNTIDTMYYPVYELSYGGNFRHFYVPAYRLLIASISITSNIDPMPLSGIMTIVIAIFIILAIYCLAYRIYDGRYVGLCAAMLFVSSPELSIFTSRPLPQLLGMFMVPLTFYFVVTERKSLTVLSAMLTALTHQITLLALVATLLVYSIFQIKDRSKFLSSFIPLLAACATYGIWQLHSLQTLDIFGISQIVYREGTVVDWTLFARAGLVLIPFFIIGLFRTFYSDAIKKDHKLLMLSWFIATLLLTKNDLIGMHIFMDRFFTFLVGCMVIFSGFGLYYFLCQLNGMLDKVVAR